MSPTNNQTSASSLKPHIRLLPANNSTYEMKQETKNLHFKPVLTKKQTRYLQYGQSPLVSNFRDMIDNSTQRHRQLI